MKTRNSPAVSLSTWREIPMFQLALHADFAVFFFFIKTAHGILGQLPKKFLLFLLLVD